MTSPLNPERSIRYLDLDGDGVLDAVETSEVVAVDVDGDGSVDVFATSCELDGEIDDDGIPHIIRIERAIGERH